MKSFLFHRIAALACLAVAGFLSAPKAKTLLVIPLKIDSVKIKDFNVIREMYSEALGTFYGGTVKTAKDLSEPCADKECALEILKAQGGDEAVFGAVRVLGAKYFLSSSIVEADGKSFAQQIGASNVEDFENATKRIAEALVKRENLEQVANLDNITEKEENLETNRRSSFYSSGGSIGFTMPFGDSYQRYVRESSSCTFGCSDSTTLDKSSQIFTLGWNNWFEFKNHLALEMDFLFYAPIAIGGDVNLEYLFGNGDFTPFAGGGMGVHYVFADQGNHKDGNKQNFGPAGNIQAGVILFRTYNMNLILRSSYHVVANDDLDNGLTVDMAIRTKMGASGDKYHHTSATTYLGMAIGVVYLIAIIMGAANT